MAFRKNPPDFQLFPNLEGLLRPDNFQKGDPSGTSPFQRTEFNEFAYVDSAAGDNQICEFLPGVLLFPAVKISGAAVVIVQYLPKHERIGGVAEGLSTGIVPGGVRQHRQIVIVPVFPAGREFLGNTSAAFRESGVADFAAVGQNLSPGEVHSLAHSLPHGTCKSLISLAMVIRADIKVPVLAAVVPFDIIFCP